MYKTGEDKKLCPCLMTTIVSIVPNTGMSGIDSAVLVFRPGVGHNGKTIEEG